MQTIVISDIAQAADILMAGGLVAIPTETVYGLAGNALSAETVIKIFEAKQRPAFDPLILHIRNLRQLDEYATDVPPKALELAARFWPGPLTLVLPKKSIVPEITTSGLGTAGFRVPAHPMTRELLDLLPFPLAAPSANPFGYVSPVTAKHVLDQLEGKIDAVLDGGRCQVGLESTIIGFDDDNNPMVYRLGGLPLEEIEEVTGPLPLLLQMSANPKSPGQMKQHYSPSKPFFLWDELEHVSAAPEKGAAIVFGEDSPVLRMGKFRRVYYLSRTGSLHEAAANLFDTLRAADQTEADYLVAETVPNVGIGRAINDRLKRAAAK